MVYANVSKVTLEQDLEYVSPETQATSIVKISMCLGNAAHPRDAQQTNIGVASVAHAITDTIELAISVSQLRTSMIVPLTQFSTELTANVFLDISLIFLENVETAHLDLIGMEEDAQKEVELTANKDAHGTQSKATA